MCYNSAMEGSGRLATTLAIIAVVISVANVLLTSPVLIGLYSEPKLGVTEAGRASSGDRFQTSFVLRNEGRGTAKSVEMVINAHDSDLLQVLQGSVKTEEKSNGPLFKIVTLRAEYLAPKETVLIVVFGERKRLLEDSQFINLRDQSRMTVTLPTVSLLRAEHGLGVIYNLPAWFPPEAKSGN